MWPCTRATARWTLLVGVCLLFGNCGRKSANSTPNILFDQVPRADLGGPDKMDTIEGRVSGAGPGQQLVLYARSEELWWIQPFTDKPFTKIERDSRWKNQTHLGTEYAALLVEPGYRPPQTTEVLPALGAGVIAVKTVEGKGPAPTLPPVTTVHFSGYDWTVRTAGSYRGGTHNSFDRANAFTDEKGALHLRVTKRGVNWICSEVKLTRSLGYGTYRFTIRNIAQLEPSTVLTLSTWDGVGGENSRRELDTEISRWGIAANDNAQDVVQPYYIPVNIVRFAVPSGILTQSIHWEPGRATFFTIEGPPGAPTHRTVNEHVFTSGVPAAGGDSVRMNLYVFGSGQVPQKNDAEVVIDKFEYLP